MWNTLNIFRFRHHVGKRCRISAKPLVLFGAKTGRNSAFKNLNRILSAVTHKRVSAKNQRHYPVYLPAFTPLWRAHPDMVYPGGTW